VTVNTPASVADTGTEMGSYANQIMISKMENEEDIGSFVNTLEKVLVRRSICEDHWLDCFVSRISGAARKSI